MDFHGKKILVMGLGLQGGGVGVARFFAEKGARVTVTDLKTEEQLSFSIASLSDLPINYVLGKHREEDFKNSDLIIRNPDVPRSSQYLKIAKDNDIPVEMDESLFLKLCPNRENVVGVTGTRGKTTTTHLIGAILKEAGFPTLLGGNLRGVTTLSLLDKITPKTKIVLELSSWQLQGLDDDKLSPYIAVITNIYPDHLNRYQSMEEYISDKQVIFKYQTKDDFLVLNKNNEVLGKFAERTSSKVVWFSKDKVPLSIASMFRLKGNHNLENLAAAYQVAKIFEISDEIIISAVEKFNGVKFRLEKIAEIDGVTYVNDTTGTTPEAAIVAFKAYDGKEIILICGGSSKKLDLTKLVEEMEKRVKAVVLLEGKGTDELVENINQEAKNINVLGRFSDFKEAIMTAKKTAVPGDVILLSPGFASFGMFNNEFERGEKFNEIVKSLAEKKTV